MNCGHGAAYLKDDEIRCALCDLEATQAQLPEGMKNCTIVFEQCQIGHGSLRGKNWIKPECPWCQIDKLKKELEVQKGVVEFVYIPVRHMRERAELAEAKLKAFKEAMA